MKKMSLVFFGSGSVATDSLCYLLKAFEVEAVITKPKPAHHRGPMQTIDLCEKERLPYYTPASKAELEELFKVVQFTSQVGLVIDYGIIISEAVIDSFTLGIINSHFSLLPEWRGADPISFALLSGQDTTGVSLMKINEAMDEGQLLTSKALSIARDDNSVSLTTKLVQLSNSLLSKHLPSYVLGSLTPYNQAGKPTYSRKLSKQDGRVDWTKPAQQIEREVRAFYSWPKSFSTISGHEIIIRNATIISGHGKPGKIVHDKHSLTVFCGRDALQIITIQPAGKKEMPIQAFLAGYKLEK